MSGRKKSTGAPPTSPSYMLLGNPKGSPTLSGTQPVDQKNPYATEGSFQSPTPGGGSRSQKARQPNRISTESFEAKIESLPDNLLVFLDHDFEAKRNNIKNLQYYQVLYHFNRKTKGRPSHKKSKLQEAFNDELKEMIKPYIRPPPVITEPMQTDEANTLDFNPLSRKTTRGMLVAEIKKKSPGFTIPDGARIDQLLWLYKHKVDPSLDLPKLTEFSRIPRALSVERLARETTEELRHGIQAYAPQIFIHSIALTHPSLVNLYIHFVIKSELPPDRVPILGFHYAIMK